MFRNILTKLKRFHSDSKQTQYVANKPFFQFYQEAVNLSFENKLPQANEMFQKSLQEIQTSQEDQLEHYSYILRRIAHNYRKLGQNRQAEAKLYEVIKHKKEKNIMQTLVYSDYDNLFKHMITYDLRKATLLARALLTEKQKKQMPNFYIKLFQFNLANAYLLAGNYEDAKKKYYEMLDADPQGYVKAYAYNNLALACWWHKNPIFSNEKFTLTDEKKVKKDFDQVQGLFSESLKIAQKIQDFEDDNEFMAIKETLDYKNQILHESVEFSSPASLYPLLNKAQFLLENNPSEKTKIMFWLHKCLKLCKKVKNQHYFDHVFVQNSLLGNSLQTLEEQLPSLITKYRYKQQFSEELFYCQILNGILKNKSTQNKQNEQRISLISQALPEWAPKLRYLAMDKLDLVN